MARDAIYDLPYSWRASDLRSATGLSLRRVSHCLIHHRQPSPPIKRAISLKPQALTADPLGADESYLDKFQQQQGKAGAGQAAKLSRISY